jgi:hypothetical protein
MSTILSTEVVPSTSEQQTLLVYDLLDAHHDTAPLAADGCARHALGGAAGLLARSQAPGPVVRSAFVYEAADIRPGMTINEYRSERAGNRHRRALHAWLRRLLSPERRPAGIRRLWQGSRRCDARGRHPAARRGAQGRAHDRYAERQIATIMQPPDERRR